MPLSDYGCDRLPSSPTVMHVSQEAGGPGGAVGGSPGRPYHMKTSGMWRFQEVLIRLEPCMVLYFGQKLHPPCQVSMCFQAAPRALIRRLARACRNASPWATAATSYLMTFRRAALDISLVLKLAPCVLAVRRKPHAMRGVSSDLLHGHITAPMTWTGLPIPCVGAVETRQVTRSATLASPMQRRARLAVRWIRSA